MKIIVFVLLLATHAFGQKPTDSIQSKDTRLLTYIKQNDPEEMRAFLKEKGIGETIRESRQKSAVLMTAEHGTIEMMVFLAKDMRIDTAVKDWGGRNPVHIAAFAGNKDMVQFLIEKEGLSDEEKNLHGMTPLHWATCSNNGLEAARYLLEDRKVSVDAKDSEGRTPLALAANKGYLETVKYLIEQAKADYKDPLVLTQAKGSLNPDVLDFINQKLDELGKDSPLTKTKTEMTHDLVNAIKSGDLNTVENLAKEKRISLNEIRDPDGYTVLQSAIQHGQLAIACYLIENQRIDTTFQWLGLKPNALQWAALRGQTEIVKYLIEKRHFNPQERDAQGDDVFFYATFSKIRNLETIRYLTEKYPINIEHRDRVGKTALLRATSSSSLEAVKFLIEELHADTSVKDLRGRNIYQCAASAPYGLKVLQYLVTTLNPDPKKDIAPCIQTASDPAIREYLESLMRSTREPQIGS
jgi:ankyrin repeat protein